MSGSYLTVLENSRWGRCRHQEGHGVGENISTPRHGNANPTRRIRGQIGTIFGHHRWPSPPPSNFFSTGGDLTVRPHPSDYPTEKVRLRQVVVAAPGPGFPLLHRVTRSSGAEAQMPFEDNAARSFRAAAASQAGSVRIAVWAFVWSAHAGFAVGAWDEAAADADRAVSLLEETGHVWLHPLARCAAVLVPAARGEWATADKHAKAAVARPGDYELMVVAAALAQTHVAAARGDHEAVIHALEPVMLIIPREGVGEPGFWPWQDLYGDALVSTGRLTEADEFLQSQEKLAVFRGSGSTVARLARVRGRLEAANGRVPAAEAAFRVGLTELDRVPLPLPFQRALLELAYGQVLRRAGQRRAAAHQLQAARDRFAALKARPHLERCDQELAACGLAPAKRNDFDPRKLTAQESAVARLVALGMGNQQVAAELFVSIKTVQFHLTHIYAKLGISTRAELAAQFRDNGATTDPLCRPRAGRASASSARKSTEPARAEPDASAGTSAIPIDPAGDGGRPTRRSRDGNRQVAELFVSINRRQFHLTHIYAKLGISTRAELAAQFRDNASRSSCPRTA